MSQPIINVATISILGILSFIIALLSTPFLTHFLYKHKLWKTKAKQEAIDGSELKVFSKFHSESETNTPRFGGVLIWVIPLFLACFFAILDQFFTNSWISRLNFLSRSETWLPLFTLVAASLVGLIDDILQTVKTTKNNFLNKLLKKVKQISDEGLSLKYRITLVTLIGIIGSFWFYFKLGSRSIYVPGYGNFYLGLLFIPFFIIVMLATYSGSVIDGLDGLSGGAFAAIFTAFAIIAMEIGMINLAAFNLIIVGSTLAFLWFNIPPARFYMGETGILGLTATLTIVAFLTGSVLLLPIIGILLVLETSSVILQLFSKKFRGEKLFKAAPIHHHFEGKGWPHYKVTMRFWIIGIIAAIIGVVIRLMG